MTQIKVSIIESKPGRFSIVGSGPIHLFHRRKDNAPLTDGDIRAITHAGPGFAPAVTCRTFTSLSSAQTAIDSDTLNK